MRDRPFTAECGRRLRREAVPTRRRRCAAAARARRSSRRTWPLSSICRARRGEYADVHADPREAGVPDRPTASVADHQCRRAIACSAPTAFAARRASPLDPPTVRRLGAALVARCRTARIAAPARRPRHARVGRLDRSGAGARRARRGRDGHERRRRADAGRRLPDARRRLRRRRRDLGVAQPVRGQRHQGVLRRGREVHRARRARGRGHRRRPSLAGAGRRRRAPSQRADLVDALPRSPARRAARTRAALGGFTLAVDCANGATTTVAPELFEQPRASTPS